MAETTSNVVTLYAEATNGEIIALQAQKSRQYPRRFFTMFTETVETVGALDRPPCYFRAMLICLARLDPIQWRRLSAREIGDATKMSKPSAERALALLQADRILIGRGSGAAKALRLNINLSSTTSAERYNQQLSEFPDPMPEDGRGR